MRLRFAADDALAFNLYASSAGDPNGRHILLRENEATRSNLEDAFRQIVTAGPLDLLLVSFAGHGEPEGWFCLVDATPTRQDLTGEEILRMVSTVTARNVLVVVDCCYAEAVISQTMSARLLIGQNAHIYLASSRATQRAWEDETLKRSIFSDVLLRSLSATSAGATSDVDLEMDVLPVLRRQVPLLAAQLKQGQVQEPVSVGVLGSPLALPRVDTRSFGRPLSIAEVIRNRVRATVISLAIVSILTVVAIDLFMYHLAVGPTGEILIRPGLAQTYPAMPFHFGPETEAGLELADIRSTEDQLLERLADNGVWGLSLDRDADGLRPWLAALEPGMIDSSATFVRALARGELETLQADEHPAPILETAFLSLMNAQSPSEVAAAIYPQEPFEPRDCTFPLAQTFDFQLFQIPDDAFARDALWYALTLPADEQSAIDHIALFVAANAYRLARAETDPDAGIRAFATMLEEVKSRLPGNPEFVSALVTRLQGMQEGWCSRHATYAIAVVGDEQANQQAEMMLWDALGSDASRIEDGGAPESPPAANLLVELAALRPLDAERLDRLAEYFVVDLERLLIGSPETLIVEQASRRQALPAALVSALLGHLEVDQESFDFVPIAAIRLLACNLPYLDVKVHKVVEDWLVRYVPDNSTYRDVHAAIGCAAQHGLVSDEHIALLSENLSPQSRFPASIVTYRGTQIVFATGDSAAVALGRVAQTRHLDNDLLERLITIVSSRPDIEDRDELILGLGFHWYGSFPLADDLAYRRLRAPHNSVRRSLEVEVLARRLRDEAEPNRSAVLNKLIQRWKDETNPELRIALAEVVAVATSAPIAALTIP